MSVDMGEETRGEWEVVLGGWLRARGDSMPLAVARAALMTLEGRQS